jgi:hypothetical protein
MLLPLVVTQIEIKSSWGGLARPQKTELLIQSGNGGYRLGSARIDPTQPAKKKACAEKTVSVFLFSSNLET